MPRIAHLQRFLDNWDREVKENAQSPSLRRALWRSFGGEFALAGVFKLLWSVFVLMGASFFVNYLIEFVRGSSPDMDVNSIPNDGVGWVLSSAFFLDAILSGIALQRMGDVAVRCGIKASDPETGREREGRGGVGAVVVALAAAEICRPSPCPRRLGPSSTWALARCAVWRWRAGACRPHDGRLSQDLPHQRRARQRQHRGTGVHRREELHKAASRGRGDA